MNTNGSNWLARAMRSWGPFEVSMFTILCSLVILWAVYCIPQAVDSVLPSTASPPVDLVDESAGARGPDMPRGATVGAQPNTAIPHYPASTFYGSPNWSSRGFDPIEALVLHVTGPGTCPGMRSWFANPQAGAAAHFGVCKDGTVEQYVEVSDAAWQAGIVNRPMTASTVALAWVNAGVNPNSRSVGIEVLLAPGENLKDYPAMRDSLYALMAWLSTVTGVPLDRNHVVGHNELDSVNRASDPVCCYTIDGVLADMRARAIPEWGATDTATGNRWNNWRNVWVSADGNYEFDPNVGIWNCVHACPITFPANAITAPINANGVWPLVLARYPLASTICAYDWPCGEALRVVYGPTPANADAPDGCPNGESTGNPLAGSEAYAGLFQLSKFWNESRFISKGWTWVDAFDGQHNVAIAYEIWKDNGWAPWSCRP